MLLDEEKPVKKKTTKQKASILCDICHKVILLTFKYPILIEKQCQCDTEKIEMDFDKVYKLIMSNKAKAQYNSECSEHNGEYILFCNDCNKHLCKECDAKKNHPNHKITDLRFYINDNIIKNFENNIRFAKEHYQYLISLFTTEYDQMCEQLHQRQVDNYYAHLYFIRKKIEEEGEPDINDNKLKEFKTIFNGVKEIMKSLIFILEFILSSYIPKKYNYYVMSNIANNQTFCFKQFYGEHKIKQLYDYFDMITVVPKVIEKKELEIKEVSIINDFPNDFYWLESNRILIVEYKKLIIYNLELNNDEDEFDFYVDWYYRIKDCFFNDSFTALHIIGNTLIALISLNTKKCYACKQIPIEQEIIAAISLTKDRIATSGKDNVINIYQTNNTLTLIQLIIVDRKVIVFKEIKETNVLLAITNEKKYYCTNDFKDSTNSFLEAYDEANKKNEFEDNINNIGSFCYDLNEYKEKPKIKVHCNENYSLGETDNMLYLIYKTFLYILNKRTLQIEGIIEKGIHNFISLTVLSNGNLLLLDNLGIFNEFDTKKTILKSDIVIDCKNVIEYICNYDDSHFLSFSHYGIVKLWEYSYY